MTLRLSRLLPESSDNLQAALRMDHSLEQAGAISSSALTLILCPACVSGYIKRLFALSSLEFCLLSELVMFMLAHFFLAPFFDVSHSSTSS
jgi:hypothetical protein